MYRIIGADGKEYGPVSQDQLRQWAAQGRVYADTLTAAAESTEWKRLAAFPEFSYLLSQPPPSAALVPRNNFFAVAGLILASFSFCCCCYGLPFSIVALLFSIIGLAQIRNNPCRYHGRGVAVTGMVLSILSILFSAGLILWWVLAASLEETSHTMRTFKL